MELAVNFEQKDLNWSELLASEKNEPYFVDIIRFIEARRAKGVKVFPPNAEIFNAFRLTPFNKIKAVIIGQDPYHGSGQAHGLSFSVKKGIRVPPSLKNIFKEIESDLGRPSPVSISGTGDLRTWAEQGVLLLNSTLTVESGKAGSHANIGWQKFTDKVISLVSENLNNVVFLLWGAHAKKKSELIDVKKHIILSAMHPSPFSAHKGFFGCRHFSKTNEVLSSQGRQEINW